MKQVRKLRAGLVQLTGTVRRYPLTILLLVLLAIVNAMEIQSGFTLYSKMVYTLSFGIFLSLAAQAVYERFFDSKAVRIFLLSGTTGLTAVYYLILSGGEKVNRIASIRTIAALFILFIAFLWIPTIKSRVTLNESFLAVFKAFFQAAFYSGVLFLGVSLIIMAINTLLLPVEGNVLSHAANIIFSILASVYLLSLLPIFADGIAGGKEENGEPSKMHTAVPVSRFLETLISYVIIPVTAVFTLVLLLYIVRNITGSFWTDNLMEPLLMSYSITVILVYLLASNIENAFAKSFRKIFPKVLVPIVLFQTIASILKIGETGMTHGRYYAILFGVFATIAGSIFCIVPVRKNGLIAPILMFLALISIVPPMDAFSVSKHNQTKRLENALLRSNMLQEGKITPNPSAAKKARQVIITSLQYLDSMGYSKDIDWLKAYADTGDFEKTFGFSQFDSANQNSGIYLHREPGPIPITGYDSMLHTNLYFQGAGGEIGSFEKDGKAYRILDQMLSDGRHHIVLFGEENRELLSFDTEAILSRAMSSGEGKEIMRLPDASFTQENDLARITFVTENIYIGNYTGSTGKEKQADIEAYILIEIK
jgi:hypothetical protein